MANQFITPGQFKQAFEAAFVSNRPLLCWGSNKQRTNGMRSYIYKSLAKSFPNTDVEYEYEKKNNFPIDAVLHQKNDEMTPYVGIEHENNVTGIETELKHFADYDFPLNVLITYTGARQQYLFNQHLQQKMNALCDRLLIIVNPEHCDWEKQHDNSQHGLVLWEYLLWTQNGFVKI